MLNKAEVAAGLEEQIDAAGLEGQLARLRAA